MRGAAVDIGAHRRGEPVLEDRLDEELGALDVRDERDRVLHGHGAREVALRVEGRRAAELGVGGDVDHEAELALVEV